MKKLFLLGWLVFLEWVWMSHELWFERLFLIRDYMCLSCQSQPRALYQVAMRKSFQQNAHGNRLTSKPEHKLDLFRLKRNQPNVLLPTSRRNIKHKCFLRFSVLNFFWFFALFFSFIFLHINYYDSSFSSHCFFFSIIFIIKIFPLDIYTFYT